MSIWASTFLNFWSIFVKPVLTSMSVNSLCQIWICFYWLSFLLIMGVIFLCFFECLFFFNWMLGIVNFTLLGAGLWCVVLNSVRFCVAPVNLLEIRLIFSRLAFKTFEWSGALFSLGLIYSTIKWYISESSTQFPMHH